MKKQRKATELTPKEQFDYLSRADKITFRDRFLTETGISYPAFYYKLRDNSFRPLEESKFNAVSYTHLTLPTT